MGAVSLFNNRYGNQEFDNLLKSLIAFECRIAQKEAATPAELAAFAEIAKAIIESR